MAGNYGLRKGGLVVSGSILSGTGLQPAQFMALSGGTNAATVPDYYQGTAVGNTPAITYTFSGTLGDTSAGGSPLFFVTGAFAGDGRGLSNIQADSLEAAGSNTQVQYNDSDAFGASANFTFGSSTVTLGASSATDLEVTGGLGVTGVSTLGATTGASITAAGIINVNNATEATSTTDGSLQTDGGLSVVKSAVIGDDLDLISDSAVLSMGAGFDFKITHNGTDGATIATTGSLVIDSGGTLTVDTDGTDAINLGTEAVAKTITIGNAASTKVDVNALAIELDSAETIVLDSTTTTVIGATTTMSVKGNDGASFGDDTGTWEFDGSGAVTETGMTSLTATPSGAITLTAGAASTLSTTAGNLTLDAGGAIVLGSANTDNIVFTGEVSSSIVPNDNAAFALGSTTQTWSDLYIGDDKKIQFGNGQDATIEYDEDGTDELRFAGAAVTFEQNVSFDEDVTLGLSDADVVTAAGQLTASVGITVAGATKLNGHVTLGDAAADNIVFTGEVSSSIVPNDDSAWNLGSTSKRFANVYTGDLHLRNERGDWTLYEESDHIKVRNNLTGKMFRMALVADE